MSDLDVEFNRTVRDKLSIRNVVRHSFGFFSRQFSRLMWCLVAAGMAVRWTVADHSMPWSLIFYMTPIAALPIWASMAMIASRLGRKNVEGKTTAKLISWRLYVKPDVMIVLIFCLWTLSSQFVNRAQRVTANHQRVLFWNVARPKNAIKRLSACLKEFHAPVIGLVEANADRQNSLDVWKRELSDYSIVSTEFGGLLAIKGTVKSHQLTLLGPRSFCEQFDVRVDGAEFVILLVDIASDIFRSRRAPLLGLTNLAEQLADRPVVIMGDFNTPDDSVWLKPLETHYQNAFRMRGSGYAPTFPVPLPVLALDQIWFSQSVNVAECWHGWSIESDHRPVISEVLFPPSSMIRKVD